MGTQKRILFFAEAVTLAHVARPVVLARGLDPAHFEVHLACDSRFSRLFPNLSLTQWPLHSISSQQFLSALAQGSPVYDTATLRHYVAEDLKIIEAIKPDVVVGDFRLSLAVSAPLVGVPYVAITNAYWSQYARPRFIVPDIPLVEIFGVKIAQTLFSLTRSPAFAYHALPLNRVRRESGLPSLGLDICRTYTYADHTVYADIPELIPTFDRPAHHHYLGPVFWSPEVPLPDWWDEMPRERPVAYVTLGSSGKGDLLSVVLEALADQPITIVAASAGRGRPVDIPANAWVADFLPGQQAVAVASLTISNGGSLSTQQSLALGVPVIGIAGNLDQYLNMSYVQQAGAGILLRGGRLAAHQIRAAVDAIVNEGRCRSEARLCMQNLLAYDALRTFSGLLEEILQG